MAHIAILPPWEGFDETAHYSYIQQIADTWELPRLRISKISKDVEDYALAAPVPYSSEPPYERNDGLTYKSYFEGPAETVALGRAIVHDRLVRPRAYTAGTANNWQAQHPPLYYLALSPVYLLTRHLSWGVHLFSLRLASYLLAWTALLVALSACWVAIPSFPANGHSLRYWTMLGITVWPVALPSWFPGMARLGNDSLSALIMAAVWFVMLRMLASGLTVKHSFAMGVLLGLGCLTKAFLVPVAAGVLAFWLMRTWKLTGSGALGQELSRLSVMCLFALGIAGWWYVGNWRQYGVLLGSDEMIQLRDAGGLVRGLTEQFSMHALLRGHAAFLTTLAWSSTWSLARPPYIYLAPMSLIVAFVAGAYISALPRFHPLGLGWIPAWLAAPLFAGFSYHVLPRIALTGEGRGTGGYYLHFLVAALAPAVGLGLGTWWRRASFRKVTAALGVYAILFAIAVSWAQVMLFAGWLFKSGSNKFYQAPLTLPPFLAVPDALGRLGALAYPNLAAISWVLGGVLVLMGLAFAWRAFRELAPPCE